MLRHHRERRADDESECDDHHRATLGLSDSAAVDAADYVLSDALGRAILQRVLRRRRRTELAERLHDGPVRPV